LQILQQLPKRVYKIKTSQELTQVERDFIDTINATYALLAGKPKSKQKQKGKKTNGEDVGYKWWLLSSLFVVKM